MSIQRPSLTSRQQIVVLLALLGSLAGGAYKQYEPYTFLHGDGASYATINRGLLEGTLRQRPYHPASWYERPMGWNDSLDIGWSGIALGRDGTWWPKHPILLPIVATPFFYLFGHAGALVADVLLLAFGMWFATRLASRAADPVAAVVTGMAFTTIPVITHSAYSYSNDVLYAAFIAAGVDFFAAEQLFASGLLLGLACWAKPNVAMIPAVLGASLLVRRRWKDVRAFALGGAPGIVLMLGQNLWMFGNPLTFPYHRILVLRDRHPVVESATTRMHRPLAIGLRSLWDDPGQGLVPMVSWGLGAYLGTPFLLRAMPAIGVTFVLTTAGYAFFYAHFDYTYARFFLPWLLLAIVPGALLVDRVAALFGLFRGLPRRIAAPLVAVCLVAVFAGVAIARRPATKWAATRAVFHATVLHGTGPAAIPCDFFNPTWQRWECSTIDREPWQFWGLAGRNDCRFPGRPGPWLWLHPNPTMSRSITFDGVPAGPLRVHYGLDPAAHNTGVTFVVHQPGMPDETQRIDDIGRVHDWTLARHASSVTLEVPLQALEWRQLCVEMDVPR